jgi:hypothetical protein
MPTSAGYELDFYAWLKRQAQALRSRDSEFLDWDHLSKEIEAIGASQKRELASHLETLLTHLLKWNWEPDKRSLSWNNSVETARDELSDLFEQSPSLRSKVGEVLPKACKRAMREAANEMGYDEYQRKTIFPSRCPWSVDQMMDEGFWPDPDA